MLYLLRPHQGIRWIDMLSYIRAAAGERGVDLDGLDWLEDDATTEGTTLLRLRLALRHGTATRTGIVVDAGDLVALSRGEQIRSDYEDLVTTRPNYRRSLAELEAVMPGTIADEDESDALLDEEMVKTLADSDADLVAALDVTADPVLVNHWRSLGGLVPDPV
ncbi:MAG: hypothetical protein ACOH2F_19065 [Cellulomonas sp.]